MIEVKIIIYHENEMIHNIIVCAILKYAFS